jgi:hypothetical protein
MTPPALDHAIRRCLAKDPEERWQMARDLMLELKWIAEPGSQTGAPGPVASRRRKLHERLAWTFSCRPFHNFQRRRGLSEFSLNPAGRRVS